MALHASEARQLVELFGGLNAAVAAPGRHLLFQESVAGGKVKAHEGRAEPVVDKRRPYYLFLLNDAVVVGKAMVGLISTSYRAHAFPLRACDLWLPLAADAKALAAGLEAASCAGPVSSAPTTFLVRLRCGGRLGWEVDASAYGTSRTGSDGTTGGSGGGGGSGGAGSRASTGRAGATSSGAAPSPGASGDDDDGEGDFVLQCASAEQQRRLYDSFQFLKRRMTPSGAVAAGLPIPPRIPVASAATTAPAAGPSAAAAGASADGSSGSGGGGEAGGGGTRLRAHAAMRSRSTADSGAGSVGAADGDGAAGREDAARPGVASTRSHDALRALESRLRDAGLTEKPSRASIGSTSVSAAASAAAAAFVSTGRGKLLNVPALPNVPPHGTWARDRVCSAAATQHFTHTHTPPLPAQCRNRRRPAWTTRMRGTGTTCTPSC